MVRINLTDYNESYNDRLLNFQTIGNLTSPINAEYVSVIRFSIPSGGIPLFYLDPTIVNSITLSYQNQSFTSPMLLEDRGSGYLIFEIDHIVSMMNTTFQNAYNGLNLSIPLPVLTPPYVMYDKINSLFSIVVPEIFYETTSPVPIYIDINRCMWRFFDGLPAPDRKGL